MGVGIALQPGPAVSTNLSRIDTVRADRVGWSGYLILRFDAPYFSRGHLPMNKHQ